MSKLAKSYATMFIITILFVAQASMFAQALSVSASGTKEVVLSGRVGKNQFIWISDAPFEKINGTAEGVGGTLTINPKDLRFIKGTISAQVATMKTGNDMRDEHLRGTNWLDASNYPAITFTADSVSNVKVSENKMTADVTGGFTMHGVTKTLTIPFTLQYIDASEKTRERAPGDFVMLTADFEVALKDFDVQGSKGIIGNKVGEKIQINAKLFGSTELNAQ
jgi:polyisoprenoid-binding protein YceI